MNGDHAEKKMALEMFADSQRWRHCVDHGFPVKGPHSMAHGIPAADPVWIAWTPDGAPSFGPTPEEAADKAMSGGELASKAPPGEPPIPPMKPPMLGPKTMPGPAGGMPGI